MSENPTQFRNLVREVSKIDISSVQAENFLNIFGAELEEAVVKAKRDFVTRHFGSKNASTNSTGLGA